MWRVTYDRHHKYMEFKTVEYRSNYRIFAWPVYFFFRITCFFSLYPVKQVKIIRSENNVVYLRGSKWYTENREQLKKLRRKKK